MRIFLSYASDDRAMAELVAQSLIERGHKVFFDGKNLPAGETYEDQIEAGIEKAGLFVFLVSPYSVEDGRFTRTELALVQKKWPSAKNRVLPVLIAPMEFEAIPAYLRAVSILEPEGNIPAETAAAVNRLARRWPRRLRYWGGLGLLAAILFAGWYFLKPNPPKFKIETSLLPYERELFDREAANNMSFKISNVGTVAGKLLAVQLQARPEDALTIIKQSEEVDLLTGEPLGAGGEYAGYFTALTNIREVRVCAEFDNAPQSCSPWEEMQAFQSNEYLYGNAFDLTENLKSADAVLGSRREGVLMAVGKILYGVSEVGEAEALKTFSAPISALYQSDTVLYVAAGAQAFELDPETFDVRKSFASHRVVNNQNSLGEAISENIDRFAHDGERLWYTTSSQTGEAGLFFVDPNTEKVERVPYYEAVSWDIDGFRLRSGDGAVWSGEANVTPASLHKFQADSHTVFEGHNYEALSCATDAFAVSDSSVLVPNCDGNIVAVSLVSERPQIDKLGSEYNTLGFGTAQSDWSSVLIDQTPSGLRFAIVTTHSNERFGGDGSYRIVVNRIANNLGSKIAFEMRGAQMLDYAVGENIVMLKLQSDDGKIENVPISILSK
ncbi:MAG: toll/interleukin-1 receptor domain-containing protein [Hellea sp.]